MNNVVLIGRWVKDLELKFLPGNGTAVCSGTLAVDRRISKEKATDYIPIVIYGKIAENTANYTAKGSLVGVSGRIETRSYNAKDGSKRYVTEVVCDEVQFLSKNTPSNIGNHDYNEEMTEVDYSETPF